MGKLTFLQLLISLFVKLQFSLAQLEHFDKNYASGDNEEEYNHNYGNIIYDNTNQPHLIFHQNYNGLNKLNNVAGPSNNVQASSPMVDTEENKPIFSLYQRPTFYSNFHRDLRNGIQNLLYFYVPSHPSINNRIQNFPYQNFPYFYYNLAPKRYLYCRRKPDQYFQDNIIGQFSTPNLYFQPSNSMLHNKPVEENQNLPAGNFNTNQSDEGIKNNFDTQKCDILCKCRNIVKNSLPSESVMKLEKNIARRIEKKLRN